MVSGSSPRGRGKPAELHCAFARRRLIPARAGKTGMGVDVWVWVRAHPRAGGENTYLTFRWSPRSGSSPRGRGKLVGLLGRRLRAGLIPARAGKTLSTWTPPTWTTAHPRAGGENRDVMIIPSRRWGSSPRGRGKHFLTCAFIERIGQILETLELAVSSGSYSVWVACATDAPQDQVRSIGLVLPSSRGAS